MVAQLQDDDIEAVELEPINLGLPALKEVGAKWLVDMAAYISSNPQIVVNGFIRSGISGALDGEGHDDDLIESDNHDSDSSDDFDIIL